jgi:hypothetical protein
MSGIVGVYLFITPTPQHVYAQKVGLAAWWGRGVEAILARALSSPV